MFGEFETKLSEESNWKMMHVRVYQGLFIAISENHYKRRIFEKVLKEKLEFKIEEHTFYDKKDISQNYFILSVKSGQDLLWIRSNNRLPLEYIVYHGNLSKGEEIAAGRPLTFYPHLNNCESPLEEEKHKEQNYHGFMNLMGLILFFSQFRLMWENYLKYGFIISVKNIMLYISAKNNIIYLFSCFSIFLFCIISCFIIEKLLSRRDIKILYFLHVINLGFLLIGPLVFHYWGIVSPFTGVVCLTLGTIIFLKLCSYIHFWNDVRVFIQNKDKFLKSDNIDLHSELYKEINEVIEYYPNSLRSKELIYFLFAPVLCFQYKYPKTERIRKRNLINYFTQFIICNLLLIFIVGQYIIPLIRNSLVYFKNDDYLNIFERILKLAIPNIYVWILMFYATFHCYLNLCAELTYFADRVFYKDWWNSLYLDEYWRTWNLPTHYWLMRHIFNPLRRRGYSKFNNGLVTFFVSAIFHEYVVSGGLGIVSYYAFLAMFMNFPFSILQEFIKHSKFGKSQALNVMFWISFCFFGQPLCVLIYVYLYHKKYEESF